ncbi:MAG UNVERIFIED_CONTAM: hypothetical protein LVR29_00560 [Microcystis novacekii LVE1205-3]
MTKTVLAGGKNTGIYTPDMLLLNNLLVTLSPNQTFMLWAKLSSFC